MSRDIPLDLIDPDPEQPRKHFDPDALEELARSMAADGLAVALMVRPAGGRYVIVHGERRWRAARSLGWETVRAEVRDVPAADARMLALVENVQRADLTPLEEARAYRAALDGGVTQAALGKRIGKQQSYVAQKLRLLTLPAPLAVYVERGALSEGHARRLLTIRSFYGADLRTTLVAPGERPDFSDRRDAVSLLIGIRPEDVPPIHVGIYPEKPMPAAVGAACEAFVGWVAEAGGDVPAWVVPAFWWASEAAWHGTSVADMTMMLERWTERIRSAIYWCALRGDDPNPEVWSPEAAEGWGHRSDARHAGVEGAFAKPWPHEGLVWESIRAVNRGDRFVLPSSLQSWSSQHKRYAEAVAAQVADDEEPDAIWA